MSTKCMIVCGAIFRLYTDLMDDDFVFLALEGIPLEAGAARLVTPFPVAVWQFIRQFAARSTLMNRDIAPGQRRSDRDEISLHLCSLFCQFQQHPRNRKKPANTLARHRTGGFTATLPPLPRFGSTL
jgi:hypothetical protein